MSRMRLIDADALLEKLSQEYKGFFVLLRELIEEQPAMICKTIKKEQMCDLELFDTVSCYSEFAREDMAKEIGYFMMKNNLIDFTEKRDKKKMRMLMTALARVIVPTEKGEQLNDQVRDPEQ